MSGSPSLREFQEKHAEDIANIDYWAAEYAGMDTLPSQIIEWVASIDTARLKERAENISTLGSNKIGPFNRVFSTARYGDLKRAWDTDDAVAFYRYSGADANSGLEPYLENMRDTAGRHFSAISRYIKDLELIQGAFLQICNEHIIGFPKPIKWVEDFYFGLITGAGPEFYKAIAEKSIELENQARNVAVLSLEKPDLRIAVGLTGYDSDLPPGMNDDFKESDYEFSETDTEILTEGDDSD